MDNVKMYENYEFKGIWYLPKNDSQKRISGILKLAPDTGILLELIGAFPRDNSKEEIILGIIENGQYVTLLNTFEIQRRHSHSGFTVSKIRVNYCFIGSRHLSLKKDFKFNIAYFSFRYIDEWLCKSEGFKFEHNSNDREFIVKYKFPEREKISINKNIELTINSTVEFPTIELVQKEAKIIQKMEIVLESKSFISFENFFSMIFNYQNLMILLLQRRTYLNNLLFIIDDKKRNIKESFYTYLHTQQNEKKILNLNPFEILLTYPKIKHKFECILTKWYDCQKKLHTCFIPYFNNFYKTDQYYSDRFLNIARAIEAFHRDVFGIYKPKITGKKKLEYTFKERFVEVYHLTNRAFNGLLNIRNAESFANEIRDLRNDFTHSNPLVTDKDKRFLKTYELTDKITIILTCAILKHLSLSIYEIRLALKNCMLYSNYVIRKKLKKLKVE